MRRIYGSGAPERDEEQEPPSESQRTRWVDRDALGRLLIPDWLRHWAISIEVSTPRSEYSVGAAVPFTVTMKNSLPFPVTIPTSSPLLWTWYVDGVEEASHVSLRDPPDRPREFSFDRGERKQFGKQWSQMFRVSDSEWDRAGTGEYTIGAGINVEEPGEKGLYDETTVRIVPES